MAVAAMVRASTAVVAKEAAAVKVVVAGVAAAREVAEMVEARVVLKVAVTKVAHRRHSTSHEGAS